MFTKHSLQQLLTKKNLLKIASSLTLFLLPFILVSQCPGNLTVTDGNVGTWVNTAAGIATVRITATGAGGGKNTVVSLPGEGQVNTLLGGRGATMIGTFTVAPGASLLLIAGKAGNNSQNGGSGGGGSGVVNCGNPSNCSTGTILIIAGGGGGTSGFLDGGGGSTATGGGGGGTNAGQNAAGGGGLNASGQNGLNGATGGGQVSKVGISVGGTAGINNGLPGAAGGNGMGGGGASDGGSFGAGGGGYTGGNAENLVTTAQGGSSFNSGSTPSNTAGLAGGGANAGSVMVECLSILPVELVNFSAKIMQEKTTMLSWQTATETNNKGFEVQRMSMAGSRWLNIGFVAGNGTTYLANEYTFLDKNPLTGANYYRLRQIDFNGDEEYSKIVRINVGGEGQSILQAFPNPVSGAVLTLLLADDAGADMTVQLFSPMGQLVRTKAVTGGTNTLDISDLSLVFTVCSPTSNMGISVYKIVVER